MTEALPQSFADEVGEDFELRPAPESYQQRDHDPIPQSYEDIAIEDLALRDAPETYQQRDHDSLPGDGPWEFDEDHDLPHDGSTDPVAGTRDEDLPQSFADEVGEDHPLREASDGYQQRDHDPLPGDDRPWLHDDDDELPHDGSTDPVGSVRDENIPESFAAEVGEDIELRAIQDSYQQRNNDDALPESFAAPFVWDDDADDLDILDDYDNTGPDEAFQSAADAVDDDAAPHDGSTDPVHLPGVPAIAIDQPWDEPPAVDDDEPLRLVPDGYQQRNHDPVVYEDALGVEDDPELPHDGSTDPVAPPTTAPDNDIPQSFAAPDAWDEDSDDLDILDDWDSTLPDQPWDEAVGLNDPDDEPPHDGSTDALQREHDVQPWDGEPTAPDDDPPLHDGSTDAILEIIAQPDQPWDEPLESDEDQDLAHDGSTDALQREHDVQPHDGIETFVDDDELPHDGSTGPVPDQDPQNDIPQSFPEEIDDLEAEELPHDGSTEPVSSDPGAPEPEPGSNLLAAKYLGRRKNVPFKPLKKDDEPKSKKASPRVKPSPLLLGLIARGLALPPPDEEPAVVIVEPAAVVIEAAPEPPAAAPVQPSDPMLARVDALEQQMQALRAEIAVLRAPPVAAQATPRDPVFEALHAILPAIGRPIDLDEPPPPTGAEAPADESAAPESPPATPPKMTREEIERENMRRAAIAARRLLGG